MDANKGTSPCRISPGKLSNLPEGRRQLLISYRSGDVWSPHVPQNEPLREVVLHFADCIRQGKTPVTDGEAGLRVVRILDAAQRSIKAQGGRISL